MNFYQTELPEGLDQIAGLTEIKLYQNRDEYRISVFFSLFTTAEQVEKSWRKVSGYVASAYQSGLTKAENDFEKWNIYHMFLCVGEIEKKLKFEIENDKFSARKIILGSFSGEVNDQASNRIISQHITNEDLVINPAAQSEDLQDITSKYRSATFVWDIIKDEQPLNYKTESQKTILDDILSRINDENK